MSAAQNSRFGLFLFVLVFALCLGLAFGVGYRLGQSSAVPEAPRDQASVDPLTPQEFWSYSPQARPPEQTATAMPAAPDELEAEDVIPKPAARSAVPVRPPVARPVAPPAIGAGPATPQPAPQAARGRYTLYIASVRTEEQSRDEMKRLASKGIGEMDVVKVESSNGAWYRVRQGRYATKEEARVAGQQMTDNGTVREFWVGDAE